MIKQISLLILFLLPGCLGNLDPRAKNLAREELTKHLGEGANKVTLINWDKTPQNTYCFVYSDGVQKFSVEMIISTTQVIAKNYYLGDNCNQ